MIFNTVSLKKVSSSSNKYYKDFYKKYSFVQFGNIVLHSLLNFDDGETFDWKSIEEGINELCLEVNRTSR